MAKRIPNKGQGAANAPGVMPWPTSNPRAREEWDYRVGMLAEDEVARCHEYEMGRMLFPKHRIELIKLFRSHCPEQGYDAYFRVAKKIFIKQEILGLPERFFTAWPEWPEQPYLSVPAKERQRRLGEWLRFQDPDMIMQVGMGEILAPYIAEIRHLQTKPEDPKLKFLTPADLEPDEVKSDLGSRIVAFRLDDHCSEQEFVNEARNWFRADRKKRGIKPVEKRGAAADTKKQRADLCAIGFWRLVRSGLRPTQIVVLTSKVSGKPIISDHKSAWSRAMARVKQLAQWTLNDTFTS